MNTYAENKKYDLEDRTFDFSKSIIRYCRTLNQSGEYAMQVIIRQIIRSSTSVGANYAEANNASSKADFRNKIFICKKEIQESKYWLKLLFCLSNEKKQQCLELLNESHELLLIFQKITKTISTKVNSSI